MSDAPTLSVDEIEDLARRALVTAGAAATAAQSLAKAVAAAERDGIASHGLAYVPTYCLHLVCGKVNPSATPKAERNGATVRVDADCGFAHPAIDLGLADLVSAARGNGIAALAIFNSYNCGVLGYHTERLAAEGLVGLGFTNAPASIAPAGGRKPVLGTNPWSLAVPDGSGGALFVADQSASVVAKSELMRHQRAGKTLPEGWALDAEGQPTTDPQAGLKGTMVPAGGYKGVGSALLVEVMAACLAGATLGIDAAPFSGTAGGPPRTGQMFIAISPDATSGGGFAGSVSALAEALVREPGVRLPGARRLAARKASVGGIAVDPALLQQVRDLASTLPDAP